MSWPGGNLCRSRSCSERTGPDICPGCSWTTLWTTPAVKVGRAAAHPGANDTTLVGLPGRRILNPRVPRLTVIEREEQSREHNLVLLTRTEAARALGIGRTGLYELLQTGVLESVHIGACRRIPTEAVLALVARLRGGVADGERV